MAPDRFALFECRCRVNDEQTLISHRNIHLGAACVGTVGVAVYGENAKASTVHTVEGDLAFLFVGQHHIIAYDLGLSGDGQREEFFIIVRGEVALDTCVFVLDSDCIGNAVLFARGDTVVEAHTALKGACVGAAL